jgi:hypothetical protein
VEFDGPSHFLASGAPTGVNLLKRRYLQLLGHTFVSLPFWEWIRCKGACEREQYLRGKLGHERVIQQAEFVSEQAQKFLGRRQQACQSLAVYYTSLVQTSSRLQRGWMRPAPGFARRPSPALPSVPKLSRTTVTEGTDLDKSYTEGVVLHCCFT